MAAADICFNNGAGNRNDWFFGWVAQYQLSEKWTLGGEIFHSTPQTVAQGASTGFSLGGYLPDRPATVSCCSRPAGDCRTPHRRIASPRTSAACYSF